MRLIIHAGTHKTASTAFQRFCAANQSCLQSARIFYPKFSDASEHNQLAWLLQKSQLNPIKRFFEQAASDCGQRNCTTTLISSEDFENLLVDTSKIRVLEDIAMQAGFSRIHWVFVVRQGFGLLDVLSV